MRCGTDRRFLINKTECAWRVAISPFKTCRRLPGEGKDIDRNSSRFIVTGSRPRAAPALSDRINAVNSPPETVQVGESPVSIHNLNYSVASGEFRSENEHNSRNYISPT